MSSHYSSHQQFGPGYFPDQATYDYVQRRPSSVSLPPGRTFDTDSFEPRVDAPEVTNQYGLDELSNWSQCVSGSDPIDLPDAPASVTADVNDIAGFLRSQHEEPWAHGISAGRDTTFWPIQTPSTVPKAVTIAGAVPASDITFKRPSLKQHRASDISTTDSAYWSASSFSSSTQAIKQNVEYLEQAKQYTGKGAPPPPQSAKTEPVPQTTSKAKRKRSKTNIENCSICNRELKNPSDATKHRLTHTKPYRCDLCQRKEGFATVNDLERHKKSVHGAEPKVGKATVHICAACPQPTPGSHPKIWPRLDNFTAHIRRKHQDLDMVQLIKSSECPHPQNAVSECGYASQPAMSNPPPDMDYQDWSFDNAMSRHSSQHSGTFPGFEPIENTAMDPLAYIGSGSGNYQMSNMQAMPIQCSTPRYSGGNMIEMRPATFSHHMVPSDGSMGYSPTYTRHSMPDICVNGRPLPESGDMNVEDRSPKRLRTGDTSPATSQTSQTTTSCQSKEGKHECPECGKIKNRECDLRKHMKRHTRPYGCTFAKCNKKFGSRNDWKRHENSQHFLSEMWRCGKLKKDGSKCGRLAHNENHFAQHLFQDHDVKPNTEECKKTCRNMHLGREGHHHFWCGFCNKLIEQDEGIQPGAWDVRFKHIGDHFDKENKNIDEWVDIEKNKKKKFIDSEETSKKVNTTSRHDDDSDLGEDGIPDIRGGYSNGMVSHNWQKMVRRKVMTNDEADADGVSDDEMN